MAIYILIGKAEKAKAKAELAAHTFLCSLLLLQPNGTANNECRILVGTISLAILKPKRTYLTVPTEKRLASFDGLLPQS